MHALHELVQRGLVRYIGMSSCYAWECECFIDKYVAYDTDLQHTTSVHVMQSASFILHMKRLEDLTDLALHRLRDHARPDPLHLHAKSP